MKAMWFVPLWKLLDELVVHLMDMGSFDYIAGRFADGNFAQDGITLLECSA